MGHTGKMPVLLLEHPLKDSESFGAKHKGHSEGRATWAKSADSSVWSCRLPPYADTIALQCEM